jgi:hypothetical protein
MKRISTFLLVATASVVAPACDPGVDNPDGDGTGSDGSNGGSNSAKDEWNKKLEERTLDYSAALRIASLRLTGDLPTLPEINSVAGAADDAAKKAAYETLVDAYIARPTFARQMMVYFRDVFKMGGTMGAVDLESAPAFAAQLAVNNGSFMDLLTATTNTCPTFNAATNTFTPAACANGVTTAAGVLTNPGAMAQFNSNFAFRRVRWVQETFNCEKFPSDLSDKTETYGGKIYNGKFPWASFAGKDNGGRIDFHDTSAVVCGNCHNRINKLAPLFANFNATGQLTGAIAVFTPLGVNNLALASDYMPAGEGTAYKFGKPAASLAELGAAMSTDPEVAACAVKRIWNWALGKADIVDALTLVPDSAISTQIAAFTESGFKLKDLIRASFVADDFTKF